VCDKSFDVASHLQQHEQGQKHLKQVARAVELAATGVVLEEEQAREAAREAAEQAAEHAARLEPVLAAGCGVCGIQRFNGEALMRIHKQSRTHARAVARAAQAAEAAEAAEAAAAAAESVAHTDDNTESADQVSSSSDFTGGNADADKKEESTDHDAVEKQQVQAPDPVPHRTIPDHIQAIFEANQYEQPEIGEFIIEGTIGARKAAARLYVYMRYCGLPQMGVRKIEALSIHRLV
jgi:hypothetical protein